MPSKDWMESVGDSGSSSGTNLNAKSARSGERGIALTLSPLTGSSRRSFNSTIFFRATSVMVIMAWVMFVCGLLMLFFPGVNQIRAPRVSRERSIFFQTLGPLLGDHRDAPVI